MFSTTSVLLLMLIAHMVFVLCCLAYVDYLRLHVSFKYTKPKKFTILKFIFVWSFIPIANYPLVIAMFSHSMFLMSIVICNQIKGFWSKLQDT